VSLPPQTAVGAHLTRHARHLASKAVELVHHGVECFFQLQNLATHVDGDLAGEVAIGDGRGHLSDVAHLPGQVTGHEVDLVGEVFPGATYPGPLRLATELAFGADFTRHARHLAGKSVELVHHDIEGVFQFEDFTLHVHGDLARQVTARHRSGDLGDV